MKRSPINKAAWVGLTLILASLGVMTACVPSTRRQEVSEVERNKGYTMETIRGQVTGDLAIVEVDGKKYLLYESHNGNGVSIVEHKIP